MTMPAARPRRNLIQRAGEIRHQAQASIGKPTASSATAARLDSRREALYPGGHGAIRRRGLEAVRLPRSRGMSEALPAT